MFKGYDSGNGLAGKLPSLYFAESGQLGSELPTVYETNGTNSVEKLE